MAKEEDGRLSFEAIINDKAFMKKLDDINKGIQSMGTENEKTNTKIEQSNKKLIGSFGSLSSVLGGLKNLFVGLAGSFGIFAGIGGVIATITSAVRSIGGFDKSMTNLAAIAGKSRKELGGLEKDIRKIAGESVNTANAVADMATSLIKLGTTPEAVRALLKPVNDLSIAFDASADSVAVLLKGTLNAFQATEKDAQRFADVMAMSANKTALGFTELSDAFTYIASSANAMGYSIEQTSAMMGVLVDNNVQASSAGRVLSSTFGRLAKQGLTLESQLDRVTKAQDKMGVSAQIFGAEGARLGLILANNQGNIERLTKEFENAEGSLAKLTEAQLKSISATYEITKSAIEELFLSIDDGTGIFSNFVRSALGGITSIATALSKLGQIRLSDEIQTEQIDFSSQIISIMRLNEGTQERVDLINQLKKAYPEYLGQMNSELASNNELRWAMNKLNNEYSKRVLIQRESEKAQDLETQINEFNVELLRAQSELISKMAEAKIKYNLQVNIDEDNLQESARQMRAEMEKKGIFTVNFGTNIGGQLIGLANDVDNYTKSIDLATKEWEKQKDAVLEMSSNLGILTEAQKKRNKELADAFYEKLFPTTIKTDDGVVELTEQQLALLDKIAKVERELTYGFLDTREAGLAKIVDKYKELVKEAEKLNMSTSKLKQLQATEQDLFNYKLDTDELEKSLQEQKALYEDFEQFKKSTSQAYATDIYKDQIDATKEYIDLVQDEMEKIDLSTMSAKEAHRYKMLEGLVVNYYKEKTEIERDQLEQLFIMTQTTEEKINAVRAKYAKLNADLSKQFTGVELENRQAELAKQAQAEFDTLSKSILDSANNYADVTELVAGATRNQIESQILSLTNFIKSTEDLTENQVNVIQAMIDKLRIALPSAEGQSSFGATQDIQNEYRSIENTINQLLERIKILNNEFGEGSSESAQEIASLTAQISGLQSRLNDLKFDSIIASGQDLEKLGNDFLNLADNADFAGSAISGFLGTLGGIVSTSGNVIGALGNIGKGLSDIKGAGGLGDVFKSGKANGGILGGLGSVAGMLGPITSGASAIFGIVNGIGKKQREEYRLFKQWQEESIRGEREYQALLRERNYASISNNQPDKDLLTKQMEVAKQNQAAASKQYLEQLEQLQKQGSQIIERYRKKSLFGSKTKTKWGDLMGVDFDELEKLSMMGKLDEQSQKWFEELVKVKQELEDIGLTIEDLERQYSELMTGTDWRAMSQTFADMFANATNSAENFALAFEDLIKNAIVAGFKAKYIDKEMQDLFDKLAKASEDGELTQEEIDKLTKDALDKLEKLQKQWERLTGNLGLEFGNGGQDMSGKDTVKRITEVQADRMTGAIMGMQVSVIESNKLAESHLNILSLNNKILNESYSALIAIERNTYNTNLGVEGLRTDVQQLQVIMRDNNNRLLGL